MSLKTYFNKARRSKSYMIWLLLGLILLILLLYMFGGFSKRSKQILMGTGIVAVTALGLEVFEYDIDLGILWETGSLQAARVENKNGVKLIGLCVSDNLNCANFTTQYEAQKLYEACALQIQTNNRHLKNIKNIDVYGLDGDNDGIVCEHLPSSN